MDFTDSENYLLGTINETISRREPYRLERMRHFASELGNPHDRYPTVHVGGTSGKGSTSTMCAAALQAMGLRVGLHTKPHLHSITERARVDGVEIPRERFAEILTTMMPAIERTISAHGRPSYYETLLALAFAYFAQERVDVAVIEVGLGGRLDGTNIITPVLSVITSVGFDHMDVLGDTIAAIATEKAGIIKSRVPVVSGVDDPVARAIVEAEAARLDAPLARVSDCARVSREVARSSGGVAGQSFVVTTDRARYDIAMPLLGGFQRRNAATAIVALERLPEQLRPDAAAVTRGLAAIAVPGRMEVFAGHPTVLMDIAHNAEKAENLAAALTEYFPDRRFIFVVAVGESKDAAAILRALGECPGSFIFTSFAGTGRDAMKPARLASLASTFGAWGRSISDPVEALAIARRTAAPSDVIVVTGSTFVVAELRAWWLEHVGDARPHFA